MIIGTWRIDTSVGTILYAGVMPEEGDPERVWEACAARLAVSLTGLCPCGASVKKRRIRNGRVEVIHHSDCPAISAEFEAALETARLVESDAR